MEKHNIFFDGDGSKVDGSGAIFPIFTQESENEIRFLATGFFISNYGVFATAKHVVMKDSKSCYDPLWMYHVYKPDTYIMRRVDRLTISKNADVAIGVLDQYTNTETGQPLLNKVLNLTATTPELESYASTFAYPRTKIGSEPGATYAIHCNTSWHHGSVVEHLPDGRDRVFLPGDCYRTNINIPHGASGGPVMNKDGLVFAINSTGWDGTDDSYVSSIRSIFNLHVQNVKLPNGIENPSVVELAKYNFASIK